MSESSSLWRSPLLYLAALAVSIGAWCRFHGLGVAPFSVDEYYLARSIDGILRTGVPSFVCGGLYMRGLILQYSAAAIQLAGASAESAPRLVCALSSLISIPAIYLLGTRARGRLVGLLAVIVCALSVWEIEMARFGRMYAPFQMVFVWYVVFFLRYTCDADKRSLWPMIVLSIAAPFVWEGGIFLAIANLLSLFLRRWPDGMRREDWIYLFGCLGVLGLVYWFLESDFRGYRADSWPPGYSVAMSPATPDRVGVLKIPLFALTQHILWLALAALPLAATIYALLRVWAFRGRRFLSLGLLVMLLAAVGHQLLLVFSVAILMLLVRLTDWEELFGRRLVPIHIAIVLFTIFWGLYAMATVDWHGAPVESVAGRAALLAYQFVRFPDVVPVVVRPWARAIPHLGAGLLLFLGVSVYFASRGLSSVSERTQLILLIVLVLAAGATTPPREETRYVFFLYPVAVVLVIAAAARLVALLVKPRAVAAAVTAAVALGGFALSEDFQPRHLLNIDRPAETFRVGMLPAMEEHLIIRTDYRAVAQWLDQHRAGSEIVINGVHGLDHYYSAIDYFYVAESDPNFPDWSCRKGTVERWGNYPLLYTLDSLAQKIGNKAYFVSFSYDQDAILASLAAFRPKVLMATGDVIVIELRG